MIFTRFFHSVASSSSSFSFLLFLYLSIFPLFLLLLLFFSLPLSLSLSISSSKLSSLLPFLSLTSCSPSLYSLRSSSLSPLPHHHISSFSLSPLKFPLLVFLFLSIIPSFLSSFSSLPSSSILLPLFHLYLFLSLEASFNFSLLPPLTFFFPPFPCFPVFFLRFSLF